MNTASLKSIVSSLIFESAEDGRQLGVPYIIGEAGDGKSAVVKQLCAEHNAALIDIRLALEDVPDLKGFPHIVGDQTCFATPDWIPTGSALEQYKDKDYIVIFFDEMARAKLDVHQVIFKMVLDFEHAGISFDKKVRFVAADNPATKDYKGVNKLDAALMNRFIPLSYDGPSLAEWTEFERPHSDPMIIRFINEQTAFYRKTSNDGMNKKASPRTLSAIGRRHMKSSLKDDHDSLFNVVSGLCGAEFAAAYIRYCESSYQAIKAVALFESGERDFESAIRQLKDWNTTDGKQSDAIADTVSDIKDYFRDKEKIINFSIARFIKILNSLPADKAWEIVNTFADDRASDFPPAWRKINEQMTKSTDIVKIINAINRQIGDGKKQ